MPQSKSKATDRREAQSLTPASESRISRREALFRSAGLIASAVGACAPFPLPALARRHRGSAQAYLAARSARPQNPLVWAVGIEDTFVPQVANGFRPLDEYELTQHYRQWRSDLDRAAELGVKQLRWGVPWYRVEREPGVFDWSWVDEVISHMVDELKIEPIIDLVHYGTPNWLTKSFLDHDYVKSVERYATEFVRRYGDKVSHYTAMNEPTVAADFCCQQGIWPPYGHGESNYVLGILSISRGIQQTVKAIRKEKKEANFIAVESMHWYRPLTAAAQEEAVLGFYKDLIAYDLARGAVNSDHPLYHWLTKHGAAHSDLSHIESQAVEQDVVGVNFYSWSALQVHIDDKHKTVLAGTTADGTQLRDLLHKTYGYVQKPLFVTETSCEGSVEKRLAWMRETVSAVESARSAGIPVIGYTWFPMYTMIDWAYRTNKKPLNQNLLHLGLYDAEFDDKGIFVRRPTPLVKEYKAYATNAANGPVATL